MLPPGPSAPPAAQTIEWITRPTALMRRCAARYGEPFTLCTLWADAPMVLVSDPETVRRVYAAPEESLSGGASSTVLEPFVGPSSILLTTGATRPFFAELLADTEFAAGDYDTGLVGRMRAREAHPSQSGTTQRSPRR